MAGWLTSSAALRVLLPLAQLCPNAFIGSEQRPPSFGPLTTARGVVLTRTEKRTDRSRTFAREHSRRERERDREHTVQHVDGHHSGCRYIRQSAAVVSAVFFIRIRDVESGHRACRTHVGLDAGTESGKRRANLTMSIFARALASR